MSQFLKIPVEFLALMDDLSSNAIKLYLLLHGHRNRQTELCCPSWQSIGWSRARYYKARLELEDCKLVQFNGLVATFLTVPETQNPSLADSQNQTNFDDEIVSKSETESLENRDDFVSKSETEKSPNVRLEIPKSETVNKETVSLFETESLTFRDGFVPKSETACKEQPEETNQKNINQKENMRADWIAADFLSTFGIQLSIFGQESAAPVVKDREVWKETLQSWRLNSYSVKNIAGMLSAYQAAEVKKHASSQRQSSAQNNGGARSTTSGVSGIRRRVV